MQHNKYVRGLDGALVPHSLKQMNCGGIPVFDIESGISYRCDQCFAVIGSIGQPDRCKQLNEAEND
jgi:hypothetical protein